MIPYACTEVTIPRLSSPKNYFCSHNTVVVNAHVDGRTCEGLISLLTTSIADHTPVVVRTFNDAVSPAHESLFHSRHLFNNNLAATVQMLSVHTSIPRHLKDSNQL